MVRSDRLKITKSTLTRAPPARPWTDTAATALGLDFTVLGTAVARGGGSADMVGSQNGIVPGARRGGAHSGLASWLT
eukprot:3573393-Prymnesium_polylepis.1